MRLEFKPRFMLFLTIVFFFFSAPSFSQANTENRVGVKDIRLLSVDYFEAKLEVDFYSNEDIDRSLLGIYDPAVSRGYMPVKLSKGLNSVVVYIQRNKNKDDSIQTDQLKIVAYQGGREPYYKSKYKFTIFWPGPEYKSSLTAGKVINVDRLDEIKLVLVNKDLNSSDSVIKSLLESGFPISKINTYRSRWKHTPNNISISDNLSSGTVKSLLKIISGSMDSVPSIHMEEKASSVDNRVVTIGTTNVISKGLQLSNSDFESLNDNDLLMSELLSLLSISPRSLEEKSIALYEEAYALLDTGNKSNRLRAKSLLDELIGLNPDFTRAYLEVARFHMKSNWPAGLHDAERSILIAKDIDPDMADVRVLLGYVYTHQGRYEDAEKEYVKAERLGTNNLWLDANWGLNFEKQGSSSEAIKHYLRVINQVVTSDRNERPKKWVFRHSGLLPMLIADTQYKLADDLYGRSAEQYYYHNCERQKQAALRLYHMSDVDGAIASYLHSKKSGCNKDSPVLAAAYYSKWQKLKNSADKKLIKSTFRQAESTATGDDELFYSLAKSENTATIISELTALGHDINHVNPDGMTALLKSIQGKDYDAIERLLVNGADINQQTLNAYYRPVVYATYLGDIEAVKLLIKLKVDYQISLDGAENLSEFALGLGFDEISKLLQKIYET